MPSRPQISREQILRTALEMLMEEGYESIRITTVAERLARIAEYACFLYAICALAAAIVACAAGESSLAG